MLSFSAVLIFHYYDNSIKPHVNVFESLVVYKHSTKFSIKIVFIFIVNCKHFNANKCVYISSIYW